MQEERNYEERKESCIKYFNAISELLSDKYEVLGSCNNDYTLYLIPFGTSGQLSYYGKPANSIRCADHWNWYSNTKKCSWENYIQCLSADVPWARKRTAPGKSTRPRSSLSVQLIGETGV